MIVSKLFGNSFYITPLGVFTLKLENDFSPHWGYQKIQAIRQFLKIHKK